MLHILLVLTLILLSSSCMLATGQAELTKHLPPRAPVIAEGLSVVEIDNGVIMGNSLPRYGTLCNDVNVLGNPYGIGETLYTLQAGTQVRLWERSQGGQRNWVMIQPAHWVRMSDLCEFK